MNRSTAKSAARDGPPAGGALHDVRRVEGGRDRGQVRGRVGVRERAAERAAVPHLAVADGGRRGREQRRVPPHQVRGRDLGVCGHRADDEGVAVEPDAAQAGHAAQVHQQGRRGQAQPQHRQQLLPAGENLAPRRPQPSAATASSTVDGLR